MVGGGGFWREVFGEEGEVGFGHGVAELAEDDTLDLYTGRKVALAIALDFSSQGTTSLTLFSLSFSKACLTVSSAILVASSAGYPSTPPIPSAIVPLSFKGAAPKHSQTPQLILGNAILPPPSSFNSSIDLL